MKKKIQEGYTGIKFQAICMDKNLPAPCEDYKGPFKESGLRLLEYGMATANCGNISTRIEKGFLITSSGCNLGCIDDDELSCVEEFSLGNKLAKYRGCRPPSSETFLHGLLYEERSDIGSIIHAHDNVATSMDLAGLLDETGREEPYGTVELARLCLDTFKKGNDIIVLKNHGYVAIGPSLAATVGVIIDMHRHLVHLIKKKDESGV